MGEREVESDCCLMCGIGFGLIMASDDRTIVMLGFVVLVVSFIRLWRLERARLSPKEPQ